MLDAARTVLDHQAVGQRLVNRGLPIMRESYRVPKTATNPHQEDRASRVVFADAGVRRGHGQNNATSASMNVLIPYPQKNMAGNAISAPRRNNSSTKVHGGASISARAEDSKNSHTRFEEFQRPGIKETSFTAGIAEMGEPSKRAIYVRVVRVPKGL